MARIEEENENHDLIAPLSGVIYGEIAFWFALAGLAVSAIGVIWYLSGGTAVADAEILLEHLLEGATAKEIWKESTDSGIMEHGHWYLYQLGKSDAVALLGISVCALGSVVGIWGAWIGLLVSHKEKEDRMYKLYVILALVIAIILTLSATGLLSLRN